MENPVLIPEAEVVDVEGKPRIGMLFNSEKKAYDFYNSYGGTQGFSIRRDYANWSQRNKSLMTSRRFVCSKHGLQKKDKRDIYVSKPRAETRIDCQARIGICLVENGKYKCHDLIEEHNHILHLPTTAHMMRSQRKTSNIHSHEIDLADDSGIKPKAVFEFMGKQAGEIENLGYTRADQNDYLRTKRQRGLQKGEAGSLIDYFKTQSNVNRSFTYSVQWDDDEQITNIFWADPKMIIDYAHFGDVVSFDTTFCTNKECRPFGFNHHKTSTVFGAALLYDETTASFQWLFEAFANAHGQKKRKTIFTDQGQAMAKALSTEWPGTWHGLCTWHLMQNGIANLSNLMKDCSGILRDVKKCIFEYEEKWLFELRWQELLCGYGVENNSWLQRIYGLKHKWAKCYMKNTLTLGMQSTQLSESLNSDLKYCLNSRLDVRRFFTHFESVLNDKRAVELKAEFDSRNKLPRNMFSMSLVIKQAAKVYTPTIFGEFQVQYNFVNVCYIKYRNDESTLHAYLVAIIDSECEYKVFCNPQVLMVTCSCKRFETVGLLCSHSLKVLDVLDIKCIPEAYILRRWTRRAKDLVVEDNDGKQIEEDMKLDCTHRYRCLCPDVIHLALKASESAEGYAFVKNAVKELRIEVGKMNISNAPQVNAFDEVPSVNIEARLKKKHPCKGGRRQNNRRQKSWVENQGKKRNNKGPSNSQHIQEDQAGFGLSTQLSMSNPPNDPHRMENNFSFTSLLMGTTDQACTHALSSQVLSPFLQNFQEHDQSNLLV